MKHRTLLLIGLLVAAALYVAYTVSGADAIYGLWDWLQSLVTRASLKVNALMGVIVPSDTQTEAVAIALDFIAGKEGFSSRAYPDPPGQSAKFSIAYGHQIVPGDGLALTSVVTESEGRDLLSSDVQSRVDCVFSTVTIDGLTANQLAALISFCYNVGCGAFQSSTLVSLINQGDLEGAANEFSKWVYANHVVSNALIARRTAETELFLS